MIKTQVYGGVLWCMEVCHFVNSHADLPVNVNVFKIDARAGLSFGMFRCTECGYQTEDTLVDMAQHFWSTHPELTFGGQRICHLQTGNEYCGLERLPQEKMPTKEAVDVLHRWLGNDVRLFDSFKMSACWDAICQDANEDGIPDYNRVAAALERSGYIRPGKCMVVYGGVCMVVYVRCGWCLFNPTPLPSSPNNFTHASEERIIK
jgi:hypothetical protein